MVLYIWGMFNSTWSKMRMRTNIFRYLCYQYHRISLFFLVKRNSIKLSENNHRFEIVFMCILQPINPTDNQSIVQKLQNIISIWPAANLILLRDKKKWTFFSVRLHFFLFCWLFIRWQVKVMPLLKIGFIPIRWPIFNRYFTFHFLFFSLSLFPSLFSFIFAPFISWCFILFAIFIVFSLIIHIMRFSELEVECINWTEIWESLNIFIFRDAWRSCFFPVEKRWCILWYEVKFNFWVNWNEYEGLLIVK